jgi:pimeloyl-ACP methyl ester carboxylesterase
MSTITTKDGTQIHYKDWGKGQPIVFPHGWPLTADDWDGQMLFFGQHGYRVVAHDRRGHGRLRPDVGRQRNGHVRRRSRCGTFGHLSHLFGHFQIPVESRKKGLYDRRGEANRSPQKSQNQVFHYLNL